MQGGATAKSSCRRKPDWTSAGASQCPHCTLHRCWQGWLCCQHASSSSAHQRPDNLSLRCSGQSRRNTGQLFHVIAFTLALHQAGAVAQSLIEQQACRTFASQLPSLLPHWQCLHHAAPAKLPLLAALRLSHNSTNQLCTHWAYVGSSGRLLTALELGGLNSQLQLLKPLQASHQHIDV